MLEIILIVDVGSNFTQMIARKIRELKVYCEIYPYNKIPTNKNIKGIILSDSSYSIDDPNSPKPDFDQLFKADIPILAIGYSAQRLAQHLGGQIEKSATSKNVIANFGDIDPSNTLVQSIKLGSQVLSAGGSVILSIPDNNKIIMRTETSEIVGFQVNSRNIFGIQFHPVADQTADGVQLLENFVVSICQCRQDWTPARFIHDSTKSLKDQLQDDKVVLGLSGGVDSSVAAMLLHKAIGKNLHCIFVDNGLLRKNEFASVLESYHDIGLNIKGVQAADRFYKALAGVTDPEKKRKAIGHIFIEIFDDEAHKIKEVRWLG
jgi:GMP synthase (glutamine-hydrolysing)